MTTCNIWQHSNLLVLSASHRSVAGFYFAAEPVRCLPAAAAQEEVGAAMRHCLAEGKTNVPVPSDWKVYHSAFLKAAGFRSWKALEGSAKSCEVSIGTSDFQLLPLKNGGSSGPHKGFQPFGATPVLLPLTASDRELGRGLLEALVRAE